MKWTKPEVSQQANSTDEQEEPMFSEEDLENGRSVDPMRIAAFKMLIDGLTPDHRDEMLLHTLPLMEDIAEVIATFMDWASSELTIRGEDASTWTARDIKLKEIRDAFEEIMGKRDAEDDWAEAPSKAFIKALQEIKDGGDQEEIANKYMQGNQ